MEIKKQMSESFFVGILLALSGGCMDAYSYICRGKVFANAQTGNMLLFGVNLAENNIDGALHYLWPVVAFTAGIVLSDLIRYKKDLAWLHWRQLTILIEIIVLSVVCFIPQSMNALGNILTSLVCGLQVESFRTVEGNAIATTMCIGNLRSGTNNLDLFFHTRQKEYIRRAVVYFSIILFFVIGAVMESFLIHTLSEKAILFSVLLLLIVCLAMWFRPNKDTTSSEDVFIGD